MFINSLFIPNTSESFLPVASLFSIRLLIIASIMAARAKYLDKNYGSVLILWDRIFGTFQPEEEKPAYGVTTPLNTWNPVVANASYYLQLVRWARQCRSLNDGMKVLFGRPGKLPGYLTDENKEDSKGHPPGISIEPCSQPGGIQVDLSSGGFVLFVLDWYY